MTQSSEWDSVLGTKYSAVNITDKVPAPWGVSDNEHTLESDHYEKYRKFHIRQPNLVYGVINGLD